MQDNQPVSATQGYDSLINADRRDAILAHRESNKSKGQPLYSGFRLEGKEDLLWIMSYEQWNGRPFVEGERPDLRNIDVSGLDLRNVELSGANLSGADFSKADMRGADLSFTILKGAYLSESYLIGVDLFKANLSGANFFGASLVKAHLRGVNLSSADLSEADLSGAWLINARFNEATILTDVKIDLMTKLRGIAWNGVPIGQIKWPSTLGDENEIASASNRRIRIDSYRSAAQAYREIALALRQQGLIDAASHYRLREQRLEQGARFLQGPLRWPQCMFFQILDWIAAYGEQPWRTFIAYLLAIISFASAYYFVALGTAKTLDVREAVILSFSSFHGRGFFPTTLTLSDPLAVIAAGEAVVGLFIELIFIATFSRRFLSS